MAGLRIWNEWEVLETQNIFYLAKQPTVLVYVDNCTCTYMCMSVPHTYHLLRSYYVPGTIMFSGSSHSSEVTMHSSDLGLVSLLTLLPSCRSQSLSAFLVASHTSSLILKTTKPYRQGIYFINEFSQGSEMQRYSPSGI